MDEVGGGRMIDKKFIVEWCIGMILSFFLILLSFYRGDYPFTWGGFFLLFFGFAVGIRGIII